MEQQKLPNATAVLVLGILSIISCCCGLGVVFGIIALVLAGKDMKLYRQSPELYSNYSNLNTGRILAIIGVVLSALILLKWAFDIYTMGWDGYWGQFDEVMRAYEEGRNSQQ